MLAFDLIGSVARENVSDFLDIHGVEDPDEKELLSMAVAALCQWQPAKS